MPLTILKTLFSALDAVSPAPVAHAHCDGPCGVYDPASARIAAEAVLSMTKKIQALPLPDPADAAAVQGYHNSLTRYVQIKDAQAKIAKDELLVLWTDFFKPEHLAEVPDLHDIIWMATKEASYAKQEVSLHHAQNLLDAIERVHHIFWGLKKRDVAWYTAS
jgi:nickel superoxide dismutase